MGATPVLALRFALAMALLAIGPLLVWDLLRVLGVVGAEPGPAANHEASMLAWCCTCAAVLLFARWQPVGCAWRPVRARSVLAAYLPAAAAWLLLLLGYLWLMREVGEPVAAQWGLRYLAAAEPSRPGFLVVLLGVCVGAPLAEEVVFRGYLQGALLGVLRPWAAVLVTAAVFGAIHGLAYALPIGLLGVLFGWLRVRHGSLLPAVFAHALHNSLTAFVTVVWPQSLAMMYPA